MAKKHMFKYSVFSSSKKLFACLITIAFYSTCFAFSGSGTAGDPYIIASVADFDVFANPANAATYWASGVHTKLACDIDLPGTYATAVIAPDTDNTNAQTFDGIAFAGEFNGNDYKITNLTIDSAGVKNSHLGLFGQIAAEGQVMNLGIENVNITSNGGVEATYYVGSLCGRSLGTITNCYTTGSVTGTYTGYIGGLVGQNQEGGIINSCYSNVSVSTGEGSGFIGGLAGVNIESDINNCYATGSVTATYNTNWLGGLIGINIVMTGGEFSTLSNCYATGSVANGNASSNVGGLVGENNGVGASVNDCFLDIETGGPDNGIGTGKTTAQMQDMNTYLDTGWDFVGETDNGTDDYWHMPYQTIGYPMLFWQRDIPGDFTGGYGVNFVDFAIFAKDWLIPIATSWLNPTQTAKLLNSDWTGNDHFGCSVAIAGNIAIVGAYRNDDGGGNASGSAYLFDIATGTQFDKLTASDAEAGDYFGWSVAIDGNVAIIGARLDDDGGYDFGSAYLFGVTTGVQIAKLTASDAAAGDHFGCSVAIYGDVAIVGATEDDDGGSSSGSAYLFDVTTGTQLAKLTASDAAEGDAFGVSVAIDSNIAIVGAAGNDDDGSNSGSAYLFDVTTGTQLSKLTASDAAADDWFGRSVAIDGNIVIVGAYGNDDDGSYSGSAYLFDVTTGTQLAKLLASDAEAGDSFGWSVAIDGNIVIVGASGDDEGGASSGSAYLFDVTTGTQLAKLTASDATGGDNFGGSVAIAGDVAIVGAALKGVGGYIEVGAVYLFEKFKKAVSSVANLNKIGSVDLEDLMIFCDNWLAGVEQPIIPGDLTKNGKVDFEDLTILVDQWLQPPGIPSADIAPYPDGDGVVNFLDFAIFAENWLAQSATVHSAFVADYNGSSPTIDGVLSDGEWGSSYTVTMDRRDGGGQHDIDLYFQQDGTYLFVGVDSQWGSGWDVVWDIAIDGDYSRTINGNLSQPYTDIDICQQSPSGYSGYKAYYTMLSDISFVRVGYDSGASSASSGSTNVSYEFRVPLADLDVISEASVGFTITHGYDGISEHLYEFVSRTTPENWATLQIVP